MVFNVMQLIASLGRGGAERVVVDLALHLDRDKYQVVVVYLQGDGELRPELRDAGIEVIRLPDRAKVDPRTCWAVYQLLKQRGIDILHAHIPRPAFWGLMAARAARVPIRIFTEHNVQLYSSPLTCFYPAIVRLATDIICVSDRARDSIQRRYPKIDDKLVTIRNGIRVDRVTSHQDTRAIREELSLREDAPVICHIANMYARKAQDQLLQAFSLTKRSVPNSKLLMVGGGPLEIELRSLAKALRIDNDVIFAGVRSDVPELLAAADVFALSSHHEGLPITILEAMAAGLPVVTTDVGGCAEAVQDGITGLVVPPNSPKLLAKAVMRILGDPSMGGRMGAAGRDRVVKHFSVDRFVEQHEQFYENALARTTKRGGM